ncbi:MAG: hypothetical protein Q9226_008842 [Calogaya cf. arnoldii]
MIGEKEKEECNVPAEIANDSGAPLPVRPDNHTEQKASSATSHHILREERYDLPDEYQNLDKVKEPSPIELSDALQSRGYLEDPHSSTAQSDHLRDRDSQQHHELSTQRGEIPLPSSNNLDSANRASCARHRRVSRLTTHFYTISYLIFFSILGTLARIGLQALTFYPGAPVVTGVIWANVAGSFIMGFLAEDRKLFVMKDGARTPSASPIPLPYSQGNQESAPAPKQVQASVKKTIPLYIGLSTGFCGSLTSFSSFIRDAFLTLANALPIPLSHTLITSPTTSPTSSIVHRSGGYSFMALLAVIITTVALSSSALVRGGLGSEQYSWRFGHLTASLLTMAPKNANTGVAKQFSPSFLRP